MSEISLETILARLERLEREFARFQGLRRPRRALKDVVGMFRNSEFMPKVDAEIQAYRQEEQERVDRGDLE
jgi:hypothetical protein